MQNDAKHFQPSGIHTFKSLKTMLCKSPFARLGTLVLLFSIFQNCWSTQFALLVQLFFKREFPLHWHLINIAVGWNAVGNNASAHSVRFWKFFHSSPKCFVIRIIVSKLGDIGKVLGCTRFRLPKIAPRQLCVPRVDH